MKCPICQTWVSFAGHADHGERLRYSCPRCGRYEITRTALAALRRSGDASNASARLSHAIRMSPKKDSDWFSITSTNIYDLISKPLPNIETQMKYLLKWLCAKLGDGQFGGVALEQHTVDNLTGIVGAVNPDRVNKLVDHAADRGLIERRAENEVVVTQEGWEAMSSALEEDTRSVREAQELGNDGSYEKNMTVKVNCNKCHGERNAFQRRIYKKPGSEGEISWCHTMEILECRGCGTLSMRYKSWSSEWDEIEEDPITGECRSRRSVKTTLWPARSSRKKPEWADRIGDEAIRRVLDEVYIALDHDLTILAANGARTLLDLVMSKQVDDPSGGFQGKVEAMGRVGRIGKEEEQIILVMVDVGHAAAHRGHVPSKGALEKVMGVTESLLHREFILPADTEAVRKETPTRPATKSKNGKETRKS